MEFFDPKKEVLRFQFTSYGLAELSKGIFDPQLFVAHDDAIVYSPSLGQEDFLEELRTNMVFIKTNKLPFELEIDELGAENGAQFVAYPVREELDEANDNLARSSFHARVIGTKVAAASETSGGVSLETEPVFVLRSEEIPQSEIPNESGDDDSVVRVGGKYYKFVNGYLLLDVVEGGTETEIENFECFLYEVIDGEEIEINLNGMQNDKDVFVPGVEMARADGDIDILCDGEIPNSILCSMKSSIYAGDKSNVFVVDDGVVSDETSGRTCKVSVANHPVVYIKRNEGELGDGCRDS